MMSIIYPAQLPQPAQGLGVAYMASQGIRAVRRVCNYLAIA